MCLEFRAAGWRVEDKASGMLAPPPLQNFFMFAGFSSLCDCTPTQLQAFCCFQSSKRGRRRIFDAKCHGFLSIYRRYRCNTFSKPHLW